MFSNLNWFMLGAVVLAAFQAQAYIPHSQTIVGRLVRNDGRGAYTIEQDVQFRTAGEPLTLRERWTIENGETMRLTVSSLATKASEPIHFEIIYAGGRRTAPDLTPTAQPGAPPNTNPATNLGALKSTAPAPEFIEGFFHARTIGSFFGTLYRSHIVPAGSFHEKPRFAKPELAEYPPEPLVRLGRTSGVVTWIFGEPTSSGAGKLSPALWIEQDAFHVRRIRYPSEAEVTADKFFAYPGNLQFPRERTVTWGPNTVSIRVVSVKPGAPGKIVSGARGFRLPDIGQVKEFYSRFR